MLASRLVPIKPDSRKPLPGPVSTFLTDNLHVYSRDVFILNRSYFIGIKNPKSKHTTRPK
jgi:hypothetical protein